MRKKKINFSSKRKRNNLNVKRCALIAIAAVLVIVVGFKGVNATTAFIEEKRLPVCGSCFVVPSY